MHRLCLLGCVLLLSACREKAPEEGALRVTVKYSESYVPACVRVEVQDAQGHKEGTDIPSSQFQQRAEKELRIAVLRKAEWAQELSISVSSFDEEVAGRCSGNEVERRTSEGPVPVPPKKFSLWETQLMATDADGDGHLAGTTWGKQPDCDDKDRNAHPGAKEDCSAKKDLDCNSLIACQESFCRGATCDDGNACTTGDHCEGEGTAALCLSTGTVTCTQPTDVCSAPTACQPATGLCKAGDLPEGIACNDNNPCTNEDRCSLGTCVGTALQCATGTASCRETTGTCNRDTGACDYKPLPVATACDDKLTCTTSDQCDVNGTCIGTPLSCAPPAACFRIAQACTPSTECRYEVDPDQLNKPCGNTPRGTPGVCMADGACSPFPYSPHNFDPNSILASQVGELRTDGAVVFDTTDRTWIPDTAVPSRDTLTIIEIPQASGYPAALLIPVRALQLNGTLEIV
ncbi:MAG: hypothetical protein EOO70_04390, partial [Myxococcaceae bacterium]